MTENAVLSAKNAGRVVGVPFKRGGDPRQCTDGAPKRQPKIAYAFWRIANRQTQGLDRSELDALCEEVWALAKSGNIRAAELIFDRLEGKAVQPVEDVTPDAPMTPEERNTRIQVLMARAGKVLNVGPSGN